MTEGNKEKHILQQTITKLGATYGLIAYDTKENMKYTDPLEKIIYNCCTSGVSLRTRQQLIAAVHIPWLTSQAPLHSHNTVQILQRGDQKSSEPPAVFLQTLHSCH